MCHISVAMSLVVVRIFTGHPLIAKVISVRRLSEMRWHEMSDFAEVATNAAHLSNEMHAGVTVTASN